MGFLLLLYGSQWHFPFSRALYKTWYNSSTEYSFKIFFFLICFMVEGHAIQPYFHYFHFLSRSPFTHHDLIFGARLVCLFIVSVFRFSFSVYIPRLMMPFHNWIIRNKNHKIILLYIYFIKRNLQNWECVYFHLKLMNVDWVDNKWRC